MVQNSTGMESWIMMGCLEKDIRKLGRLSAVFRKMRSISDFREKKVLLVYDYDNKFCHDEQPHVRGFVI